MVEFKVSAPGKIILFGEHAVVYGKTAVAASLALRTSLDFKELPVETNYVSISMPKVNLTLQISVQQIEDFFFTEPSSKSFGHDKLYKYVQKFVEQIDFATAPQRQSLEAFFYLLICISQKESLMIRPFQVHLDTALSISSGLGSSASFAVCISTCFYHWSRLQKNIFRNSLNETQLREVSAYALDCERIIHGTPSGIDNTICTLGSIIEYRKGDRLIPIYGVKIMRVLLVDTRVPRSTKTLVESIAQLKSKYPKIFDPVMESINNVSQEALSIIRRIQELPEAHDELLNEAHGELMTLMKVNQGLLDTCNVSHPSLDAICAEAKNYGLAAKLTGAGGGGYAYILLLPSTPNEVISSLSRKLIANGYLVTLTNLGGPGVEIHT